MFWQAMSNEVNDRSFFASTAAPAARSSRTASRWPPFAASSRGVNALSLRASMLTPPSRSWQAKGYAGEEGERGRGGGLPKSTRYRVLARWQANTYTLGRARAGMDREVGERKRCSRLWYMVLRVPSTAQAILRACLSHQAQIICFSHFRSPGE